MRRGFRSPDADAAAEGAGGGAGRADTAACACNGSGVGDAPGERGARLAADGSTRASPAGAPPSEDPAARVASSCACAGPALCADVSVVAVVIGVAGGATTPEPPPKWAAAVPAEATAMPTPAIDPHGARPGGVGRLGPADTGLAAVVVATGRAGVERGTLAGSAGSAAVMVAGVFDALAGSDAAGPPSSKRDASRLGFGESPNSS